MMIILVEFFFNDEDCRWMPFEVITHIKKKKQFNGLEVD